MNELKKIAGLIIDKAKAKGADTAQVVVVKGEKKEFNIEGKEFTLMRTLFEEAVSLTVFCGGKQGAVNVNSFDEGAIDSLVNDAVAAAASAVPDDAWEIDSSGRTETFEDGPVECDTERLFERTKELLDTVYEEYPKLIVGNIISEHIASNRVYLNSYGTCYESKSGCYEFGIEYSAHEGENSSSFSGVGLRLYDLDTPFADCSMVRRDMHDTELQAVTTPLEGKFTGTVIFKPECLADVVFNTILGNFVSDVSIIDGTSTWKDKIGEKVADERISFSLCPHDETVVCGANYSGEGYLTEDFDVIKDGVLCSFVLSQYGANKTGRKRSGNTTGSMIIKPGDSSLDEMIAKTKRGIIVGRFSGGIPGASGEFSGIAKNSFLIEDGKITCALSETMISANLNEMLNSLLYVSAETSNDGYCSVPYMAFDGVTISGK